MPNYSIRHFDAFDNHRFFCELTDPSTNLQAYVAIHRGGIKTPAFGATRIWSYKSTDEAIQDALKLSKMMSYKSAMAGLPYGGAKAVIISPATTQGHKARMASYGSRLRYLQNAFCTGADVGMSPTDVGLLSKYTNNIVGNSIDPVKYTVDGVYDSIVETLYLLTGKRTVEGRSFAIQGLGKTGFGILEKIAPYASKIYITDLDSSKIRSAKKLSDSIESVDALEIYGKRVDIFSPCAISNTLNSKTVSKLKAHAVVGSANCQLENDEIGELLHKLGILYAPDYIVNAGGVIAVVDEYENGKGSDSRISAKVAKIQKTLKSVFETSKRTRTAPSEIADTRAKQISDSLV